MSRSPSSKKFNSILNKQGSATIKGNPHFTIATKLNMKRVFKNHEVVFQGKDAPGAGSYAPLLGGTFDAHSRTRHMKASMIRTLDDTRNSS